MAKNQNSNPPKSWLDQRLDLTGLSEKLMTKYWLPKKINFLWTMGAILLIILILLIISGLFLTMYYKPDTAQAFDSVNYTIMQEVSYGWLFRHIHAVGASVLFLIMYIHLFTGIYYASYKNGREIIWLSGMFLFGIFSIAGFSGYILPWGQMSYWAATVITNLFSGVPFAGEDLVIWIRGNFNVSDPTLTRFFMIHICLAPMIIIFLVWLHLYSLRIAHANNETGEKINFKEEAHKYLNKDKWNSKVVPFWPVCFAKDIFSIGVFLFLFFALVFFGYEFALDPVNFEQAKPLVTPNHIYPEWYFLWSYEILRSFFFDIFGIKAANIGLICFCISNIVFFMIPWLDRNPKILPAHKRPLFKYWFWLLIIDFTILTIFGKLPLTKINLWIGFIASVFFIILFISLPFISKYENKKGIL